MKKWQKSAVTFSVATALLLSNIALPIVNNADAAPQKQAAQSVNIKNIATLSQMKAKMAEGKTINSENFGIGSSSNDITKKWGKPFDSSQNNLWYDDRQIEFFVKAGKVTSIYSYDKRYKNISYEEVSQVFGKAVKEGRVKGDAVYDAQYKVGKHTISFAFSLKSQNQAPNKVLSVTVK